MEKSYIERIDLFSSSYLARSTFYENFYNTPFIKYVKSLSSDNPVDCIVIPCTNTFGIKEGVIKDAMDYVNNKIENAVKSHILSTYYGDQPVGSCIILPYTEGSSKRKDSTLNVKKKSNKLANYICWVPACRSLATLGNDASFNVTWNALCAIKAHNNSVKDISKKKMIRSVAIPCVVFANDSIPDACRQMAIALKSFFSPVQDCYDRESGYLYAESIIRRSIFTEEDRRKELEGLLYSREIEQRGLCSEDELDILIEWVNMSDSNTKTNDFHISAARALVALLRRKNTEFTLSNTEICEKITSKNSGCLPKLLELGLSGKIELHNEIKREEIEIIGKIGDGNAGSVYKARYDNEDVAVKFFSKGSVNNQQDFIRELALLSLIKHPLVVTCYGGGTTPGDEFIVTELMESSVYDLLHDETFDLDSEMILDFAISTAKCMNFLHNIGIIHRDLKSLNLLVSKNFEVKICDFGLSRVIDSNHAMTSNVGTVSWIAPEIFAKKNYTEKADVYSYGIILWELFTRKMPFGDIEAFSVPLIVSKGERPEIPKEVPPEWRKLIKSCWNQKPHLRPSFKKILSKLRELVGKQREERIARGEDTNTERGIFLRNSAFLQENISSDERGHSSSLQRTSDSGTSRSDSEYSETGLIKKKVLK